MSQAIQWPQKTREMQTFCLDSTYWNAFELRDDDIIIATWAKAGATWMQQIVANLIFEGETIGMPVAEMSPWLDFRLPPRTSDLREYFLDWFHKGRAIPLAILGKHPQLVARPPLA